MVSDITKDVKSTFYGCYKSEILIFQFKMTHKMNQQAHKGAKFVKLHLLFCETFFIILNSKILNTVLVFFHCSVSLVLVKKILGGACTSEKCCLFQINLLSNFIESYFENGLVQTSKMKKIYISMQPMCCLKT